MQFLQLAIIIVHIAQIICISIKLVNNNEALAALKPKLVPRLTCMSVYNNQDHWGDWSECSNSCGKGKMYSHMNELGKLLAKKSNCKIKPRTGRCKGTECPVDCVVGDWQYYGRNGNISSGCDQVKGVRKVFRTVKVLNQFGGESCPPLESEVTCKVDCKVSEFSNFTTCDERTGTRKRSRGIVYQPLNGGKKCPILNDIKPCLPKNCVPGNWTDFGECERATGTKQKTRKVMHDAQYGGKKCILLERVNCSMDCVPDQWSAWSPCNATTGLSQRTRDKKFPPLNGGKSCNNMEEFKNCTVHQQVSEWSPFMACNVTTGRQFRYRNETMQAKNGGRTIPLVDEKACKVNCSVSEWNNFTSCVASGPLRGTKTRTRTIVHPAKNEGNSCPHLKESNICSLDCVVGNWSIPSCDAATGIATKHRSIMRPKVHHGKDCPPLTSTSSCKVDCKEEAWPAWSACHKSNGTMMRYRSAIIHPKNGGQACDLEEERLCMVHCEVGEWGQFSTCNKSTGKKTRHRNILIHPLHGGHHCPVTIDSTTCRVDCETKGWDRFSVCNAHGVQFRHRHIVAKPRNGGHQLHCNDIDTRPCVPNCESLFSDKGAMTFHPHNQLCAQSTLSPFCPSSTLLDNTTIIKPPIRAVASITKVLPILVVTFVLTAFCFISILLWTDTLHLLL